MATNAEDIIGRLEGVHPDAVIDQVERAEGSMTADSIIAQIEGTGGGTSGVGRVWNAARYAVDDMFKTPLGVSSAALGPLVAQTPEDTGGVLGGIKTLNRVMIQGGSQAGDFLFRAAGAAVNGGIAATVQTLKEFGMDEAAANRLQRDLMQMALAAGVVSGTYMSPSAWRQWAKKRERLIDDATESLPENVRDNAAMQAKNVYQEGETAVVEATGVSPRMGLTEERIAQPISKKVVDAAEELLTAGGVRRDESRLISDQIAELLSTNRLSTDEIGLILKKHELDPTAFSELWRVNIKKAAQDMQTLSALSQRLAALGGDTAAEAQLQGMLEAQGMTASDRALGLWRRLDNTRRALMVSQPATAVRNFETQVGRVGLDVMERGIQNGIDTMLGKPSQSPIDALDPMLRIFKGLRESLPGTAKKQTEQVEHILSAFPKEHDRLYGSFMSDVGKQGAFGNKALNILNAANHFQERIVRNAVFMAKLDTELTRAGLSLEQIIAENRVGAIPTNILRDAVQHALDTTFGRSFSPFASGAEGMAGSIIQTVNKVPGLTYITPFPRFMMNAMKFQFEYSPFGVLKLLNSEQRAAFAAGDVSVISKAAIGTGLYMVADQVRNSEIAGEKWYELNIGGRTIDIRPFNPFASYFFAAELRKRIDNGTLDKMSGKDIINGILSSQLRAGTGAFVLDSVLDGIAGLEPSEKGVRAIQDMAGNVLASFAVPMQIVRDFMAEFDDSMKIVRSGKEGPNVGIGQGPAGLPAVGINLGPAVRNVPGVAETLPPAYSPTRSGPIKVEDTGMRQLTGITTIPQKNAGEKELDRLGITRSQVMPSTGNPTADRLLAIEMGPIFEKVMPLIVQSDNYKKLGPQTQEFVLLEFTKGIRGAAMKLAETKDPELFARIKLEGIPKETRDALIEILGGKFRGVIDHLASQQRTSKP